MVVGDIVGTGVAAALQIADLQATLRNLCRPLLRDLQEPLRSASEMFSENTSHRSHAGLKLALSTVFFQRLLYYGISTKPTGFGTPL